MNLIKYFESEENLNEILEDYASIFELLDNNSNALLQGQLTTSDQFRQLLNEATGAYGSLEPLYSLAVAYKENTELHAYVEKKRDIENRGDKIVVASLEKEASLSVAGFRRIRNILEGYVNVAEKLITTSQTQLKRIENDSKYKPQEER